MNWESTIAASPAIGFIVPSSNRIVERATRRILERVPRMDACFARVPYDGHPADGYDTASFETCAAMLAEARVDVICWNATRGALLGFEPDRRLCDLLEHRTGIPVTTTALATLDLLTSRKLTRIGLIAQGNPKEGQRLVGNLARRGIHVAAAHHLGISDNFEASRVSKDQIAYLTEKLAANGTLDAVLIWSTNLPGFALAAEMEGRIGIPVLDSTTIGVLAALEVAGVDVESAETLDNTRPA
ncbi:maleate cis-trans isomerase family protein [Mesorhizobium australicum]|uniref:Maleate isomerase n=1 Tax=Mesorhizobium australicum TaxID=536018 RepID=A0A1X7PR46_9HYPH|nr:aspartate/glutamate racemase family protein [Mesorhizobium australicum]SMH54477.1 maleate isomerase [Mesorhizobium australicum]